MRIALAWVLAITCLVTLVAVSNAAPPRRYVCADFANQAAAQAAYRADPIGNANLDADHDGIACEALPCPCDKVPVGRPTATLRPPPTVRPTETPRPLPTATSAPPPPTATPPGPIPSYPQTGNLRLIPPVRVLDTRGAPYGPIGFDGSGTAIAARPIGPSESRRFRLAGRTFGGTTLPADITGAYLNVTIVTDAPGAGYVVVYQADRSAPPTASTVNPATRIAANFWAVPIPTSGASAGQIAIYASARVDVIVDLVGYWAPSNPSGVGNVRFVEPQRVLDTRPAPDGPIGARADGTPITPGLLESGRWHRFSLGPALAGVDETGIIAHITVLGGSGGFVTVAPGDAAGTPTTSSVNPVLPTAFNSFVSAIPTTGSGRGTFAVYTATPVHVVVDLLGYYAPTNPNTVGTLYLVNPVRVVDTRGFPEGLIGYDGNGLPITPGRLQVGATRRFAIAGRAFQAGLVPADAKAVLLNVTTVGGGGGGYVTVYPGDVATPPRTSAVNPVTWAAASFWATGLSGASTIAVYSTSDVDLVIDLVGYYR